MRKLLLLIATIFTIGATAGNFTATQLLGSHRPYPAPDSIIEYPDTLKPFYISHIGRHGSRYPSSSSKATFIKFYLTHADTTGTITRQGRALLKTIDAIIAQCEGKWGDLDSIGIAEQQGIAQRMFNKFPELFSGDYPVEAIATYSPRAIMSMYAFTHRLAQNTHDIEVTTSAGNRHSSILRPYDSNKAYIAYDNGKQWREVYNQFFASQCPIDVARRLIGNNPDISDEAMQELSFAVYSLLSCLPAMGLDLDYSEYFTDDELEQLWSIDNLDHYLLFSANTISTAPTELAIPLIEEIVEAADRVVEGRRPVAANLRFAHAETLMPLLSLLQINGCYYLTHYFDQVATNWQDFNIVPMAANLQFIFFKTSRGDIYVRTDLNEHPITLIPGNAAIYLPWHTVRDYLLNFILATN